MEPIPVLIDLILDRKQRRNLLRLFLSYLSLLKSEMNESEKVHEKSKEVISNIINGSITSLRFRYKDQRKVEVDTQVDLLNETATDPNLLGRMWIGWSSFI